MVQVLVADTHSSFTQQPSTQLSFTQYLMSVYHLKGLCGSDSWGLGNIRLVAEIPLDARANICASPGLRGALTAASRKVMDHVSASPGSRPNDPSVLGFPGSTLGCWVASLVFQRCNF